MKNNHKNEIHPEPMDEELSCEALEQLTGGAISDDCLAKLLLCGTAKEAFEMLVLDTKEGRTPIGIADFLVGKIEAHYNK